MRSKIHLGFTLSELLIAVTVVGIITAITVPAVIANYQNKSMLAMLKKNFVEMQENLLVLSTEQYNKSFYQSKLATDVEAFIEEYYNVTSDCGTNSPQPCFADSYRSLSGGASDFSCSGYSVLLKSGSAMCIIAAEASVAADEEAGTEAKDSVPAHIYIDVNGPEKPNIGGRDMFSLYIYDYYRIDDGDGETYITEDDINDGTASTDREDLFTKNCKTSSTGVGCFGKILNDDWKMNY